MYRYYDSDSKNETWLIKLSVAADWQQVFVPPYFIAIDSNDVKVPTKKISRNK
ncbi:hypothetical protein DFA_11151 [Cavenderia fasciculata]|uniref:Uncharacterized protein n=1 Tax=Cavenderia fasciculata TaxID=261658 RepID=F4QF31_CACFS|nr:uncharacterized protein DFA_11151 [Cavenderia fasciculata]EGG13390.1 hypothetical protein DFA_11151 [Cavenderia fasciculata]|eukprot:XP_004350094.1 hypothetical protein DFA_11151 [Cavenderia fasciculata]